MKSFVELCELKKGDFCWENNRYSSLFLLITDNPEVNYEHGSVTFYAVVIDPTHKYTHKEKFIASKKYMQYAPKLSVNREYIDENNVLTNEQIDELKQLLLDNADMEYTGK